MDLFGSIKFSGYIKTIDPDPTQYFGQYIAWSDIFFFSTKKNHFLVRNLLADVLKPFLRDQAKTTGESQLTRPRVNS